MALIVRALRTGTFGFGRTMSRNLVNRDELTVPAALITAPVLASIRAYVAAGHMQVITSETKHGLPPNRPSTARKTLLVTIGASGVIPNGATLNKVTIGGVPFTFGNSNIDGTTTAELLAAFLVELAASTDLAATGARVKTSYEPVLPLAVAASKSLNLATTPTANDTVTINGQVYRFVVTPGATANDVALGASAAAARANLILAINAGANSGNYGTATVANALASAADGGGTTVRVSAKTAGSAGNSIALAEGLTAVADIWTGSATTLSGGLDTHAVVVIDGDDVADWAAFGEASFVTGSNNLPLTTPLVSLTFLAGVQATGTLTSNNTTPSDGDTVTIDDKVYTARTTLTPLEGEVLIGGSADAFLLNLIRAINHSGTPNTDYKCALPHPTVTAATSVTAHAFAITARVPGTVGNAITITKSAATLSWGSVDTLASNNTNVSDNDTVTINGKVYTFKTTLTPLEGEVLIGGSADASLLNLIRAINHSGTANTDYVCELAHPTVTAATSVTAHAFALTARVEGATITTSEEAATLFWGGTTLASGTDVTDTIATDVPVYVSRTLTAADVTREYVEIDTGLTNLATKFAVRITRSGTVVLHDGTVSVKASSVVLIQNNGSVDFAAGDILQVFAGGTD